MALGLCLFAVHLLLAKRAAAAYSAQARGEVAEPQPALLRSASSHSFDGQKPRLHRQGSTISMRPCRERHLGEAETAPPRMAPRKAPLPDRGVGGAVIGRPA